MTVMLMESIFFKFKFKFLMLVALAIINLLFTSSSTITRLPLLSENKSDIILITVFYRVQCTLFYIENDAKIFPAHYTLKVAEKGFKMAFMMNKLAMINSCEIILEK